MINEVYQVLNTIVNKDKSGYVSPDEFNRVAHTVQNEIFSEYFSEENRSKNRENRGLTNKGYSNLDFNDRQKIDQFSDFTGITKVGTNFPLPSDLYFITEDGILSSGGNVVEEIERARINYLLGSESSPTELYPVYVNYGSTIIIYPSSIEDITISYLREPKPPVWTYQAITQQDGSVIEMYDPTSSSFQDFELHPSEYINIVLRMLTFFGINLKEADVIKVSELLKDKSNNKEMQ